MPYKKLRDKLLGFENKHIIRWGSFIVIIIGILTKWSDIVWWAQNNFKLLTPPSQPWVPVLTLISGIIFLLMLERKNLTFYFLVPMILSIIYNLFELFLVFKSWGIL